MSDHGVMRQACSVLEEKDPEKRNGAVGFVGSARRTIAVLAFLVASVVGFLARDLWSTWPFVTAFVVSIIALPIGEALKALRDTDPEKMMERVSELVGTVTGSRR